MPMSEQEDLTPVFASIFARPSVGAMLDLSPRQFERFVEYVFRRAG